MLKKSFASVGIAGLLVLGGVATGSAAFAYPAEETATVSDSTLVPGGSANISVPAGSFDAGSTATFSTSGPGVGPGTLTSLVYAAASGTTSVSKVASASGVASAKFTAPAGATGSYDIAVTGTRDGQAVTLTTGITVAAASAGGSYGGSNASGALPATGGDVPVAALWLGVGAIGIGGVAVAAGVARRRALVAN